MEGVSEKLAGRQAQPAAIPAASTLGAAAAAAADKKPTPPK
jgi:hypothetical protein